MNPKVILAGAGIGSPKNLTIQVKEALDQADMIIYDRLLNPTIIDPYRNSKELYYVGKKAGDHTLTQDEINDLIVESAKSGKNVVRLKGGDPYIFGRGSEEALFLLEHGIDFEVLPGVTAGVVALMDAGIPATHRDVSTSVSFITGHRKAGVVGDFKAYGSLEGTLVFYMGLNNLPKIIPDLLDGGMDPKKPVAIISKGAYNNQQTFVSTVENVLDEIKDREFPSPSIIVIGDTIKLREELNFFENRPLFGQNIVITRALKQSRGLASQLDELGAVVHNMPTIEIHPKNEDTLRKKLKNNKYTHIMLMSANSVEIFFKNFLMDHDIRDLHNVKICVIGKKTRDMVRKYYIEPDIWPGIYVGEEFLKAVAPTINENSKALLLHSNLSRPKLIEEAKSLGDVDTLVAYENVKPEKIAPLPEEMDMIIFTSSSTVHNFIELYGIDAIKDVKIFSIGEITSRTIQDYGLKVYMESPEATIPSLIETIKEDATHENA